MRILLMIVISAMLAILARADSATIFKVNTQRFPVQGSRLEDLLQFNRVGTFGYLRQEPTEVSFEFNVKWSVQSESPIQNVLLRIEYLQTRNILPQWRELNFSSPLKGSRWSKIVIPTPDFLTGGNLAAWKISVVHQGAVLATQHSLLWGESKTVPSLIQ